MPEFLKRYRNVIIGALIAAAVLTAAFLSGGSLKEEQESQTDIFLYEDTEEGGQESESWQEPSSEAAEGETQETVPETLKETKKESEEPSEKATEGREKVPSQSTKEPAQTAENTISGSETQIHSCTISISCEILLSNMDKLEEAKRGMIPSDGWVLKPVTVSFTDGESVFDLLKRTCQANKIPMEFSWTPVYHSAYIEGIYNLYEFDCGSLSGWMYSVNGVFPNYGCSSYSLKDGDVVVWQYSLKRGADIGGGGAVN